MNTEEARNKLVKLANRKTCCVEVIYWDFGDETQENEYKIYTDDYGHFSGASFEECFQKLAR